MKEGPFPGQNRLIKYMLIPSAVSIALVIVSVIRAQGIFFPTDEFGYWNNAAALLGTDWTQVAGQTGSYAGGYSILLLPFMAFCKNAVVMYRAALIVNCLLIILSSFLFIRLIRLIYGEFTVWTIPCLLFPSFLVYMSYTISEVLLYVLFLELCCITVRITREECNMRLICLGFLISALMVYTHYRSVGIAVIFAVTCFMFRKGNAVSDKKSLLIPVIVLVLLMISMILYSLTGRIIVAKELSPRLLADFLLGAAGKVFYLGVSTFGIGIIGSVAAFKKRNEPFHMFFLLSFIYMVMLSTFFFCDGIRLDQPVYGRYGEMFIPLFMYIGAKELSENDKKWDGVIIFMGITAIALTIYVMLSEKIEYVAHFVNGIDWLFLTGMPKVSQVYIKPFLAASAGLFIINRLAQSEKAREICAICVSVVFLFSSAFLSQKHVWHFQDLDVTDRQLAESALELAGEGREVIFLNSPYNDYVNLLQFWFGDNSIKMTEGLDPEAFQTPPDAVVITYMNYECDSQLLARYVNRTSSAHFEMYSN